MWDSLFRVRRADEDESAPPDVAVKALDEVWIAWAKVWMEMSIAASDDVVLLAAEPDVRWARPRMHIYASFRFGLPPLAVLPTGGSPDDGSQDLHRSGAPDAEEDAADEDRRI
jgi:hypothetical protein